MQGAIDNFFKCVDELKRQYANVKVKINYNGYWVLEVEINNKVICNYRGHDTGVLFNNAANKLLDFLRSDK